MVLNKKFQREDWIDENAGISDMSSEGNAWNSLWHIKVPSKQKIFAWRLAQHSMPTGDVLHRRNMSQTPHCALCGAQDSWRHALLDCTMSRCIWALSEERIVEQISLNNDVNAKNWLFALHEALNSTEFVNWKIYITHQVHLPVTWSCCHFMKSILHMSVTFTTD